MAARQRKLLDDEQALKREAVGIANPEVNMPDAADRPWFYLNPFGESEMAQLAAGTVPERIKRMCEDMLAFARS